MRLTESQKIIKYINEDYEVGGKREQDIIKAMQGLYNMLESCTNKYINNKVIQAAYKLVKAGDEFMKDFEGDSDLCPPLIEKLNVEGLTVGLYVPILVDNYSTKLEIFPHTYLSASRSGLVLDDVFGAPGGFDDHDYIQLTNDGNIGYEMSLDGEFRQELLKDSLVLLANKEDILKTYKAYCKSIAQTILEHANEMSLNREKDIADKQRAFSQAVNEEEKVKNKKELKESISSDDSFWIVEQVENNMNKVFDAIDSKFSVEIGYDNDFCTNLCEYIEEQLEEWLDENSDSDEDSDGDEE